MRVAALLILLLSCGCTRPRHGVYTAVVGAGVLVGSVGIGLSVDDGAAAPGDGFVLAVIGGGVGLGLIGIGLISAIVLEVARSDRSPPSGISGVGWERAATIGEQARTAAKQGDCVLAMKLALDARTIDEDYYERVLIPDATLSRCR